MTDESSFIGKQIGNYRIVSELASGFFSRVYRGEHIFLTQRVVAIKLLHTSLNTPQEMERFLQEAQFLALLKHPYILPILDVGIFEGSPYLISEYALNGTLRDRLMRQTSRRPLPQEEILSLLRQVGQALYYAHQQNIVHRDLKPENILFNGKGEALLADFGIAIVLETARTKPVDIIGSPLYMAPEQFDGIVSKRSDQYALACIAYELYTGRTPFTAPNPVSLGIKHKSEYPPPLTLFNPHIPAHVEQAILKALSKERSDRYPTVSAFITSLHMYPLKDKEQWLEDGSSPRNYKRYEETLTAYEQAILNPNSAIFYCNRGNLLYDLKRDTEALTAYEQAIKLDPNLADAHEGKGNALYWLRRYDEALKEYEIAIRLDSNFVDAYDGMGWTLFNLKRYEEALVLFDRAIDLNPDYHSPYHGKGNALFELGHYREALDAYEQAIQLEPQLASVYNCKGNALWGLKRYQEALTNFERAIQLEPTEGLFQHNKANLLKLLGRTKEGQQASEKARQLGYRG